MWFHQFQQRYYVVQTIIYAIYSPASTRPQKSPQRVILDQIFPFRVASEWTQHPSFSINWLVLLLAVIGAIHTMFMKTEMKINENNIFIWTVKKEENYRET